LGRVVVRAQPQREEWAVHGDALQHGPYRVQQLLCMTPCYLIVAAGTCRTCRLRYLNMSPSPSPCGHDMPTHHLLFMRSPCNDVVRRPTACGRNTGAAGNTSRYDTLTAGTSLFPLLAGGIESSVQSNLCKGTSVVYTPDACSDTLMLITPGITRRRADRCSTVDHHNPRGECPPSAWKPRYMDLEDNSADGAQMSRQTKTKAAHGRRVSSSHPTGACGCSAET
jgi:hypothetical protein